VIGMTATLTKPDPPTPKSKAKKRKKTKLPLAARADKYKLYQQSVQEPECEVEFFDQAFKDAYDRTPRVLREDFCGTFAVCCEWAKAGKDRVATGIDLDPEPVAWGRAHNLANLAEEQQSRVTLHLEDVRGKAKTKADVLAAQNFSFWIFKTRDALREYFRFACDNLADEGIIVTDMMGGSECWDEEQRDVRKIKRFKYIWEQKRFDPISHDCLFHIHFKFKDGSKLEKVFTYEWRFWTLPEVCELMREAGFSQTQIYWEGVDEGGDGNGEWGRVDSAPAEPCWIAYIVGVK